MSVKVLHFGTASRNDRGYIADRNLYLDAAGNLVEETDPAQVRQLVGKGGAISTADAVKYGLMADVAAGNDGKVTHPKATASSDADSPKGNKKKGVK
jgi:hypothetical protein